MSSWYFPVLDQKKKKNSIKVTKSNWIRNMNVIGKYFVFRREIFVRQMSPLVRWAIMADLKKGMKKRKFSELIGILAVMTPILAGTCH